MKAHVLNSFNEFHFLGENYMNIICTKDYHACAAFYILGAAAFYENRDLHIF